MAANRLYIPCSKCRNCLKTIEVIALSSTRLVASRGHAIKGVVTKYLLGQVGGYQEKLLKNIKPPPLSVVKIFRPPLGDLEICQLQTSKNLIFLF